MTGNDISSVEIFCFTVTALTYLLSATLSFIASGFRHERLFSFARYTALAGFCTHATAVFIRILVTGLAPFTTTFEVMLSMSFILVAVYLLIKFENKNILQPFVFSAAFLLLAFGTLFSPAPVQPVPALRSGWLFFHVSLAFTGEAFFVLAFSSSVLMLIKKYGSTWPPQKPVWLAAFASGFAVFFIFWLGAYRLLLRSSPTCSPFSTLPLSAGLSAGLLATTLLILLSGRLSAISPESDRLSTLTFDFIATGLPIYTLGALIFGAIWAQTAWGRWWGWDPKETWALVTWLVYMAFLHSRRSRHLGEDIAAYLSILGFLATIFTFFGVNFLLKGLHSYI